MVGESVKKQYYWELRQFVQSHSDRFREIISPIRQDLYLYKKFLPDVIVRINEPIEKVHSWTFSQIQVLQKLNDNPRVFHWKSVSISLRGQFQIQDLQRLNQRLKDQIQECIPRRTKALDRWINAQIDDVLLISMKSQESVQKQNTVLQIKALTLKKYKNYFQSKSWKGRSWQQLLAIADREGLNVNSSFGLHIEQTNNSVFNLSNIYMKGVQDTSQIEPKTKKGVGHLRDIFQHSPEKKVLSKFSYK